MIGDILYLILYLSTEFINYILAYVMLFQAGLQKNKRKWLLGLCIIFVIHYLVMYKKGPYASSSWSFLTMLMIPSLLLDTREKKYFGLYPFVVIGTSVIAVSSSFLLAVLVEVPEYIIVESKEMTIVCQCVPIFMMMLLYIYRKIRGYEVIKVQLGFKQYLLFYIGLICTYLMLASMQTLSTGEITESSINICGFAISVACISFILVVLWQGIIVHREIQLKERNKMYEEYMEMQEEYYRQIMEQDEKMRRFRHDMNAHMSVLKSYCTEGNNSELKKYLENIIDSSAIYDVESYTGNKGVDAVIRQLIEEAKKKQVEVEIKGRLTDKTRVSVYDLCTILSNLLKNAIEACEKIENPKQRFIQVEMGTYNEQTFISVKNTIAGESNIKDNYLKTSKADKKNHGLGSGNVKNAVKKYQGSLEYSCEDGWFKVEIGL